MEFYERSVCNYDIQWAIANGWAVPPVCKLAVVKSMDLSKIAIVGGDFKVTALQAEVEKEANLQRLCMITAEEREGKTVVFTPSVAAAKGVCHYLNHNYDVPSVYVYGTMPPEERQDALRQFKSGDVQVLVNCQLVAIGFDHPPTATLILGRPTRSRAFWLQCVGRATRPLAGCVDFPGSTPESRKAAIAASPKPRFKIVDCTDASLDHRLITSVDMFLEANRDTVAKVRERVAKEQKPLTPEELAALAAEEEERKRLAMEIEERRKHTQGRAFGHVSTQEVDLQKGGQRSVGTYFNPLKGKYAGLKLNQLPDHYVAWAAEQIRTGWIRSMFRREQERRNAERFSHR